jgi:hypothetical protein
LTEKIDSRLKEKVVRENHLDFLFDLYTKGVELTPSQKALLVQNKYIQETAQKKDEKSLPDIKLDRTTGLSETQKRIDSSVDILNDGDQHALILTDEELDERRRRGKYLFEGRTTEITKEEWLPKSTIDHEDDFIEWIDSIINLGFQFKSNYRKLNLYVQQAYVWQSQRTSYLDFPNEEDREDFILEELRRCDDNTLYFLNKYVYYQEGDSETGKYKYIGHPAHEVMAYMNDCGYSMCIVKGRQIAATTTLMACDVKDMIFKKNHFMKFITEDQEKAEEIFEDKLKYAFSQLPVWMKPDVQNERDNYFKLGKKDGKGERSGVNSRIRVTPPKRTAIAGGAPQKVKIDEAGNIPLLTVMINNARPTMLMYDPKSGKIKVKRQLVFWGTGGEMEKGGMAFQVEFMSLLRQWKERNFNSAIIPIFFDWTCRPGATKEMYEAEKSVAYSKEGPDLKKSIIEFHQSWPATISDVFMTSEKTLISIDYIDAQLSRIKEANVKFDHKLFQRGYFEPIYDTNVMSEESSDTPFKIIGANFVPTDSIDPRASVTIFSHPKPGWKNRYFQGTDPISTDTGLSNMSGAIWDKYYKTVSAVLDFRTKDYRYTFLQTTLLSIYYDTSVLQRGVKELLEANIGQSYSQYKTAKGFGDSFVLNYELPPYLQNKTTINEGIGIDNKGLRNLTIVNRLHELIQAYGENIYMEVFWEQLKTFVCEVTDKGKETWGPVNRKYFRDDTLFSIVYSYICAELCYPELQPEDTESKNKKSETVRFELAYDKDFNLKRMPVRYVNGKPTNTLQTKRR